MTPPVKLPWELEEDILSRLPLQALVRFRTVCKQWNSLFNDKSFLKNHLSRSHPQFIFLANSKTYSIDIINHNKSIDPTIKLFELPSTDIPYGDPSYINTTITSCDEVLLYNYHCGEKKAALWNPWLRQVKFIEHKDEQLRVVGLGYDNSRPEKVYKMLVRFLGHYDVHQRVAIYECASHALKYIDTSDEVWPITQTAIRSHVSLNGNLYWVTCNLETHECFIRSFDFSREKFKTFCLLPCQNYHPADQFIPAVYKGDRFSLLKQCYITRKIEIWVTKNNIDREEVVWINLMTLQKTNVPRFFYKFFDNISYFIYDKTIFMCCGDDETEVACIYIVREDLCKKIPIGSGIVKFCSSVYTPNLISVPSFRG